MVLKHRSVSGINLREKNGFYQPGLIFKSNKFHSGAKLCGNRFGCNTPARNYYPLSNPFIDIPGFDSDFSGKFYQCNRVTDSQKTKSLVLVFKKLGW